MLQAYTERDKIRVPNSTFPFCMPIRQLDKFYDPPTVETRWGQVWIDEGYFQTKGNGSSSAYTIVIPPPNVTGSLHIGHAFNTTLQDILIRWRRMQGYNTLWLPGTDHAGIATQNIVEQKLLAEGKTRQQVGREAFIQRVWEWKQESGNTIINQLKKLGASCDWSRLRFTMDDGLSRAVHEVFVRLYEDGLIYRGERLINWCSRCHTALSDIEVEHDQTKGKLYHILYPVHGESNLFLTVATTRPETMLGDTAVAVHPEDDRYNSLIGKSIKLPLTHRTIPIVSDTLLVDREFGTGAVKITPAHDFNDFEAGLRHNLPRLAIFNSHAKMDPGGLRNAQVDEAIAQQLQEQTQLHARQKVLEFLEEKGLLAKAENHDYALGRCYRCKTIIEPFLSPQWFVKIQPLAEPAITVVESRQIRIIPEGWTNNYLGWMRNIKDWCISRQLWWGHQIPAWYCRACLRIDQDLPITTQSCLIPQTAQPIVSRERPDKCLACGSTELFRDPDVLDTWFSSALWPFSTLGWPEDTADFKTFYPTSTLVTGLDILFFWVSRMIMMGLKFTGGVPFRDVYIHALVRDAEGQKMSKSKGNVIDPLTKMQEYGTDALRFTLASMASPGRDLKLAEERIEGYRNFVTKIWNAARFILLHAEGPSKTWSTQDRSFADRWILARLNKVIRNSTTALEEYRFDRAASHLYQFLWHEYCDWYIELVKPSLQDRDSLEAQSARYTLLETFEIIQRLLHPFMPFLTEEIWQALPHQGTSIVVQPFPKEAQQWEDPNIEAEFDILAQFITTTRTSRALLNCSPSHRLTFLGTSKEPQEFQALTQHHSLLEHLARGTVQLTEDDHWTGKQILRLVVGSTIVGIHLDDAIDLQHALVRLQKQIQEKQKESTRLQQRLASPNFSAKADREVVQESESRLALLNQELSLLTSSKAQLQTMLGS